MADNLEKYFNKHLSDETPGKENWNVPSDEVWDKVLPEIQKKRGLFIPLRYFYLLGALIIAAGTVILWPDLITQTASENDPSVSTEITEPFSQTNPDSKISNGDLVNDINENQTSLAANYDTEEPNITSGAIIQINENEVQIDTELAVPENQQTQAGSNQSLTSATSGGLIEETKTSSGVDNLDGSQLYVSKSIYLQSRKEDNLRTISPILPDRIPIPGNDFSPEARETLAPAIPFKEPVSKPDSFDNKGKFGIGAFYAPTWNDTYVQGDLSTAKLKAGNMFLYSGNWGAELKYFISNRFTLVTGIERSEIKSWSQSQVDFEYDVSTEHEMPSGEKENMSPIPMPTPFGEINTEITYRFPGGEEIPDGELMNSVLETHQEIKYWSIPLGLEYNILRFSWFSWFAEGGLRYNRAINDATEFTSRILHEGHDMDVVDEIMTSHPTYTENYLNFYVGTGINYQFSNSFLIGGSARYFGNVTKVNLQDDMSTYVNGFSLKLGFLYIF